MFQNRSECSDVMAERPDAAFECVLRTQMRYSLDVGLVGVIGECSEYKV
jgi:hypothetical protein